MKRVIYLVTFKKTNSFGDKYYSQARLNIIEDEENGKASDKYEDFMMALEEASGCSRDLLIIINSIKFE